MATIAQLSLPGMSSPWTSPAHREQAIPGPATAMVNGNPALCTPSRRTQIPVKRLVATCEARAHSTGACSTSNDQDQREEDCGRPRLRETIHVASRPSPSTSNLKSEIMADVAFDNQRPSSNESEKGWAAVAEGLGKGLMVLLATGALLTASPDAAMAAKTGGRVGGSSFRSAPRTAAPNGRSRLNFRGSVAPPVFGGYGVYGGGGFFPFGGYGLSPFAFGVPGPVIGIQGGGGIFQIIFLMFIANFVVNFIRRSLTGRDDDDDDRFR